MEGRGGIKRSRQRQPKPPSPKNPPRQTSCANKRAIRPDPPSRRPWHHPPAKGVAARQGKGTLSPPMALTCGIVGLPNVGKSTLFNALTAAGIQAENYPFCTIEPNTGVVIVPDARLEALDAIVHCARSSRRRSSSSTSPAS